jgi:NADH:ubiquinone oxidoreductase subunit 5 (subunit L)/multisubunit Na+/H+ antiporter MnhA subunit
MRSLIVVLFFMPLLLFFIILAWRSLSEKTIARMSLAGALLNLSLSTILFVLYLQNGTKDLAFDLASLHWQDHHIDFNFFVDKLSLLNLLLSGFLFLVINRFSQSYLHRERGFARFFATINLFLFGFQLMSCAGTLDLFFAGWEIVGLCSFILIGFYFERTRVIKNAFRIFTISRICDVGLLFSAILTHTLSSDSSHFLYFIHQDPSNVTSILNPLGSLIVGLIILASLGKSAQFPFLNWPARAMEGPTPSSAVFYGALSIHGGVILIYRMLPLIEQFAWAQAAIFGIGLVTIIFSSIIARTQSNIKGQLAYLSVRQVSIMMCELALGIQNPFPRALCSAHALPLLPNLGLALGGDRAR